VPVVRVRRFAPPGSTSVVGKDIQLDLELADAAGIVTGGTRGIGRAIVSLLTREGARIATCGRTVASVKRAIREYAGPPGNLLALAGDVTEEGFLATLVDDTVSTYGRLDFIVANVGGATASADALADSAAWRETFELNVGHAAALTRLALPALRESPHASCVYIASISGWKPDGQTHYAAANAALIHTARSLAPVLAAHGVRVNTVSPGSILFNGGGWDDWRSTHPECYQEFVARDHPFGRLGQVDEVADAVAFLLSRRASWISGVNLPVDGAQHRPTPF
jgi:3-oxoacyl-[acyl-carrier protein] reductase